MWQHLSQTSEQWQLPRALILSAQNYSYLFQIKGSFHISNWEQFREEVIIWPSAKKIRSWSFSISSFNEGSFPFGFYKGHRPLQGSQANFPLLMGQRKHQPHDGENLKCPSPLFKHNEAASGSMHCAKSRGWGWGGESQRWIRMMPSF